MEATKSSTTTSASKSKTETTFSTLGNLVKLLPTGTVFVFMFLSPFLTNNGQCGHTANKILTILLIVGGGLSCAIASFTDSYTDSNGHTRYGFITHRGLWVTGQDGDSVKQDKKYKLRFSDFVHAGLSVAVFSALAVLDSDTVRCLFPRLVKSENTLVAVVPAVVGVVAGAVFALFPNYRHGVGYPASSSQDSSSNV